MNGAYYESEWCPRCRKTVGVELGKNGKIYCEDCKKELDE